MAKTQTVKRLIYKRASFLGGKADLQDIIDKAVTRFPTALGREYARPQEASLILNTTRPNVGHCTCGVVVRFTRGNNTAIMGLDPKAKELPVEQLPSPPLAGNKNTEFVENLGYIAVRKNDVILVQSMAVRSGHIEDYLNWFLRNHAGLLPAGDALSLSDVSAKRFREHKVSGVKAFHFGTGIQTAPNVVKVSSARATVSPTGDEFKGLTTLLHAVGINLRDIPLDPREAEAIKLSVKIEVNRRSYDEQSALLNLIGELANKNKYDDDYEVEFDNGLKLSGEDLYISKPVSLEAVGGIPDPYNVFAEMSRFLDELKDDPRLKM